ncbi:cellulose binding domain-containing protein [Actinoallomurus acaciae]|uniref:Cellulose binding domain-containing protein n=1 Tax=Actinoallomurus acaciae TaxID=502577 RepID=A0ABV5YWQ5_9ACTN
MPLLPAVSGVVAIGAIVSALSTQQISLNFAGGPPPPSGKPAKPKVSDSASPLDRSRRTARDGDSSLLPRMSGSPRASRGSGRKTISVAYRTLSTGAGGFHGQVTITNHANTSVRGWTLILRYPRAQILSAWDVKVVRRGTTLVADNPAGHPYIAPGKSIKVSFVASGTAARPSGCSFNGSSC